MKMRKILAVLLMVLLVVVPLIGCNDENMKSFQSMEYFEQAKIGLLTGSSHDKTAKELFPNAERVYFNNMSDMILAVEQGKIDCFLEDAQFLAPLIWEGVNLKQIDESVGKMSNGFVFPKGESTHLREQINEFLGAAKSDGTIERLTQKWLGKTEPTEHPDYSALTGENGTIRLAISVDNKPMLYQNADGFTGFEMELLTAFGQRYGYKFDIEVVPFESIIAGISANKYDMGASSLNITDERRENVDFSDPYGTFETVMAVKGDGKQTSGKTLSDFDNAKIGVLTGSVYDDYAKNLFPDAERKYFNLISDMILAVESGKIDGFLAENTYVSAALWEGAKIDTVDEEIDRTEAGFILQKDSPKAANVREQLNTFLSSAKANGLLEQLNTKWIGNTEPTEFFDRDSLSGENGTLKVAVSSDLKPLCYMKNGAVAGYEVEVLSHFAKEYGYNLEFHSMAFDAILPGVVSGKYDIGCGGMTITEERAESVDFSESYLTVDVVMVISNAAAGQSDSSFWGGIKESFEKTFIREDRWKLIVEGIGVTMLISLCAAAAGSLLGFGLYMLSRSEVKLLQLLAKGIASVYSRIIAGTPVVVILMILFYVIFGKVRDMSGILVAIIGFTLTFGAFVYDHMTVSVGSVDRGQTEAAYALGYTKNKTFFRIIFPQAMTIFLPSYCGQAVELIKATAVVGYVAVNDLTKMGDIIRSNTYEAFFPLIATAVIYFLLTWILASLLKLLKLRFEPKRRRKENILKGVKTV